MPERNRLRLIAKLAWVALLPRREKLGMRLNKMGWLRPRKSDTDGWMVSLGRFQGRNLRLEFWFDRFSALTTRNLWFGVYSRDTRRLNKLAARCSSLGVPLKLGWKDLERNRTTRCWKLIRPLRRADFDRPLLEDYGGRYGFYGFYVPQIPSDGAAREEFATRVVEFCEIVGDALTDAKTGKDADADVYAAFENRRIVHIHVTRERNTRLSRLRKEKDGYRCQVCSLSFLDMYGELGRGFAEAHHIVPLSRLCGRVKTRLEDLRTVCANCHRMLHRMEGKRSDVAKLKRLVGERRT